MRVFAFVFLLIQSGLFAQTVGKSDTAQIPRLTFKVNSGVLLLPVKQAVAFASDIRLAPRWSVDLGAGMFFHSSLFAGTEGESYEGLRTRAGLKYHTASVGSSIFFVGLEGKYQNIRNSTIKQVFRQGQQYVELLSLERKVRTGGIALRTGWQHYLGKRKRILIEQFVGLGVDYHRVDLPLPPDAELVADEGRILTFELPAGRSRRASVLLGLHIGFVLW
ncbi:MAG: hypothetical protein IPM36_18850 [Lewinellaceae bacterium]|nr:hypothetical protein [Lewinellaceae bacterium]